MLHITEEWSTDPLSFIRAEETSVVTFLDYNVGNARPVILLQTDTCLPDGYKLRPCHLKIYLHFLKKDDMHTGEYAM